MTTTRLPLLVACLVALPFTPACGDDSDDSTPAPACEGSDCAADPGDDGSTPDGPPAPVDLEFAPVEALGGFGTMEDGTALWLVEARDGDMMLTLELYEAFGAPTDVGLTLLTETETDYFTCGTCVILRTECSNTGGDIRCLREFMPKATGELRLTTVGTAPGERIAGSLSGLELQEVVIAPDFRTEPASSQRVLRIDSWSFDAELGPLETGGGDTGDGSEPDCGGNGTWHGNHCDCFPGFRRDPNDATNCIAG